MKSPGRASPAFVGSRVQCKLLYIYASINAACAHSRQANATALHPGLRLAAIELRVLSALCKCWECVNFFEVVTLVVGRWVYNTSCDRFGTMPACTFQLSVSAIMLKKMFSKCKLFYTVDAVVHLFQTQCFHLGSLGCGARNEMSPSSP